MTSSQVVDHTPLLILSRIPLLRTSFEGKLPPGPRGVPFFGNLFQVGKGSWITFTEWKKTYGPIIHINLAGQSVIVLNTHKVAADLLDRRSPKYSDRPRHIVASEILTGGLVVAFIQYGGWRRMRKAAHEGLNARVVWKYHSLQTREALLLTQGMLENAESWDDQLRRASASMIMTIVYDWPVLKDVKDPLVTDVNDFVERLLKAAFPGAHLVEVFPWMKHLPSSIAKWKRDAEEWFKRDSAMFEGLFNTVKERALNGDQRPSFSATLALEQERHGLSGKEAAWLAGTMYAAGAETTAAVLSWTMLAIARHPEVQRKAQEELDRVVGRERMPTFADYEQLPYIRAIVKETLRWRPVDPDDYYEGYYIPKGTHCIANVWAMNHDPDVYGEDAEMFNPDRHLDEKGLLARAPEETKGEGHVSYGFGRRLCIGRNIANNSLFIDIACILWAMSIEPIKDADGQDIMPDVDAYVFEGLVVRPVPFRIVTKPRIAEARSILARNLELHGV
ncbi:cytochrome P450 [Obba rivulosa]|uniref:Cytochrome P450 n=1 Tax=Obba rivulosa TaxID=1052685 RepID=A0A8E2AR74_9APHY|nr:cytochrome P450 [Obba rivulosa]